MIQYLRVLQRSPGCPKRKIFISEISIREKGREGAAGCAGGRGSTPCSPRCREGGCRCGARLLPPRSAGSRDERAPGRAAPRCSSSGTRHPAGQGRAARAGSARQAPALCGGPPRCPPLPRKSPGAGEGRRDRVVLVLFFFYLRRGAASSREGKVQAAGGRAPLSPMEGV